MCRVCVRREKSYCTVTWTSTKFSISASPLPLQPSELSGDIACSYDWIAFPGQLLKKKTIIVYRAIKTRDVTADTPIPLVPVSSPRLPPSK